MEGVHAVADFEGDKEHYVNAHLRLSWAEVASLPSVDV